MSIDAMRLALDALELEDMACRYEKDPTPKHIAKAIAALRQAIDQAEQQESVAWVSPSWLHPETRTWASESFAHKPIAGWIPLYTAPPQREWVGLTAQDLADAGTENYIGAIWADQRLKEKNGG